MKPSPLSRKSRNVLVIGGLMLSLSLTSALLLALAPSPLLPEPRSLMVVDTTALDELFDTPTAIEANRWKYIYIHHSKSSQPQNTADHFVITGGKVEVRMNPTWIYQKPAGSVSSDVISICLIGDFDQTTPSELQVRRLEQLTQSLQRRLSIPGKNVISYDRPNSPAGLGRHFPASRLRQTLLP